ncbi:MAG: shikimate dehydrogenase [Syntrophomonadaceae bacterium]
MKVYAVIGEKLPHSLSPQIHNQMMDIINIDGRYVILEIARENLPKIVDSLKALNIAGVSVTIPYKTDIMPYLDEISEEANSIGAVNVIDIKSGRATGYNSDYYGFGLMLKEAEIDVKGKEVVQLGAGGAGKASIAYVHAAGAKSIRVVARNPEKLAVLKERFPYIETSLFSETELIKGEVLVNATPIGMYPNINDCPISPEIIGRFTAAADLIYNPLETQFIKHAKEKGMKYAGGLYMLLYQAVKAQEIWQERTIDTALVAPIYDELKKIFN